KLAFNLSLFALETCVAVTAFRALAGGQASIGPRSWLPALIACTLENSVGVLGVTMAILATSGHISRQALTGLLLAGTILGRAARVVDRRPHGGSRGDGRRQRRRGHDRAHSPRRPLAALGPDACAADGRAHHQLAARGPVDRGGVRVA